MENNITCAIRRINNKKVWYLHSYDVEFNKANWTRKYYRAHQFRSELLAREFTQTFLGETRAKECDTFSEYETWTI